MKKLLLCITILYVGILLFVFRTNTIDQITTPTPQNTSNTILPNALERFPELLEWKRPEGPAKVALQVGHWKNHEFPDELERLKNNTGATWGTLSETNVNYEIAIRTKSILESNGVIVEILPVTIPPSYYADAFISIHADGSTDTSKSGFKVASPRRDYSGKSTTLSEYIQQEYQLITLMEIDPVVTRNMTGYYAFSWWRFKHAVHPMTPSTILETGFLTSYTDRLTIVDNPEASAQGLANGVLKYLESEELI
ncbi:MAG TPA: N-acetylmuramoyl-L-alanine amidase [Candidatus Levybacteria bacterium]|nr:N-acetylmuramoyl-L-alanine amidase [Candidatus Levybacteria bacterium]